MKIAIYNHGIAFDAETPFKQPLGGSESSIVYMSRELALQGHDVTVYANTLKETGSQESVVRSQNVAVSHSDSCLLNSDYLSRLQYRHYHEFFTDYLRAPWDVVISFRSFDPFLIGRVAPRTIYWTGDAFDQPALKDFGHPTLQSNIDRIFCVSEWHRRTFIETFNLPAEKVIATRNGFCRELIHEQPVRDRARAAYTSTPFRGLEILLKLFPEMRRRVPSLSLDVFSSMQVYGWTSADDRRLYGALYESAHQPGVQWHGSVAQPVLLDHLSRSGLLLYPNSFDETSCIAAIEAQAAGCVVVTSARAALNETVQDGKTGICIEGDPKSGEYQRDFIEAAFGLLQNPERMSEMSKAARVRAFSRYAWSAIAAEWTTIFDRMPAQSVHARWAGPLTLLQKTHGYLESGNVNAAKRVLASLEETPFLRNEVETLKGRIQTWM